MRSVISTREYSTGAHEWFLNPVPVPGPNCPLPVGRITGTFPKTYTLVLGRYIFIFTNIDLNSSASFEERACVNSPHASPALPGVAQSRSVILPIIYFCQSPPMSSNTMKRFPCREVLLTVTTTLMHAGLRWDRNDYLPFLMLRA